MRFPSFARGRGRQMDVAWERSIAGLPSGTGTGTGTTVDQDAKKMTHPNPQLSGDTSMKHSNCRFSAIAAVTMAHAAAFTSLVGFVCIHQRSLWWGGGGHDGCDRGETMRLDGVSSATASSRRRRRSPARSLCSMTAETSRAARVRFPASMERCSLAEMVLERRSNPTRCRRCLAKMEAVMPRDAGEGRPNAEKTGPIDRESPEPSRIATGMADASSSDREIDGCARLP